MSTCWLVDQSVGQSVSQSVGLSVRCSVCPSQSCFFFIALFMSLNSEKKLGGVNSHFLSVFEKKLFARLSA